MVDAKCDHVVETALKLIYIVFVKKDLERGSAIKGKIGNFVKKSMRNRLREITRNVGAFENVLYTSVVLSTRQRIKLLMINFRVLRSLI